MVGDACALPPDLGAFDAALSVASIKHWPDPEGGVRGMAEHVRPGGRVAIVEADPACTRRAAGNFAMLWKRVPPGLRWLVARYFREFVAGQGVGAPALRGYLEGAGLTDVRATAWDDQPFALATGRVPG